MHPLFHYSLDPGGFLFLGNAESIGGFNNLFAPLSGKSKLYRRLETGLLNEPITFPNRFVSQTTTSNQSVKPVENLQVLTEQLLLKSYSPAAVLTNQKGDILFIIGRTGKYLEPAAGKANWNIFVMTREGLRYDLSSVFKNALLKKETLSLKNLEVGTNGGTQIVNITIEPLTKPSALEGMVLIIFHDVAAVPGKKKTTRSGRSGANNVQIAELEQELGNARHEIQTIREEMQTSQEELRSTNEEMQSAMKNYSPRTRN